MCRQSSVSYSSRELSSEPALSELEGDLAADFSLTDSYTFGRAYHLFTEHTKAGTPSFHLHVGSKMLPLTITFYLGRSTDGSVCESESRSAVLCKS